ncbi:MAG: efflux RND transporter periplasmic adaptor subunit [Deltaproteobacteria bacterium]|nr:efflux RND transporter periplasmic adaptor subunit [Deltaproteobacteria bacterium]
MKKFLFMFLLLILLIASFRGGTWYSQRWTAETDDLGEERRILHYVDPMNPANVSEKPGLAPCGMPMEPVYDDRESGSFALDPKGAMSLGTVKITPQKQQIIGVQIGTAERTSETHRIRTLGRIAADENRVFPLISAVDGWMSYIPGSTTGSLVEKGQLMALIKIYDYDFFSWQQRYLAELSNIGRRYLPATNFTGARQPLPYPPRPSRKVAPTPGDMSSMDMPSAAMQTGKESPTAPPRPKPKSTLGMPFSAMKPKFALQATPPGGLPQSQIPLPGKTPPAHTPASSMPGMADHSMPFGNERRQGDLDPTYMREDDILYANKAKLELLDLGVDETQLLELALEGKYIPNIQVRSPVTGLVIDRGVSPLEKVFRGTECFRVADLSRVWILADVFNTDAKYIQPGMRARVSLPRQNKPVDAVVSDIFPEFDATTRTLKVRLEMDNPQNAFRPDMFVNVDFLIPLPEAITVPADAVLDSGRRKIVFIALGEGYFEPREVVTGWQFGDRVEIVKGIAPGEQIVVSGNFLIDSESRMKLATIGLMATPETEKGSSDREKSGIPSDAEPGND